MHKEMGNIKVMGRLIQLVKPLTPIMLMAIIMGVLGYLCAIGIPVLSSMALFQLTGMYPHLSIENILWILIVFAILRGILHYIEQACNHYIAFKILAIIRDHVFTVLRRLCPAKLDGQDKGNLISLLTNDIELLEVFYAHTISPIAIAMITCLIMLKFFAHMHIVSAFIALCSYLIMALVIPFYVDKKGRKIGQDNRQATGEFSSYILESFRGLLTLQQYQKQEKRRQKMIEKNEEIEDLQASLKSIESIQMISSQLFITISSLTMLSVGYALYLHGQMSIYDVIMSTILMVSSFGPVLALSSLSNNLLSTLSSGRRVIALLDEEETVHEVQNQPQTHFGAINTDHLTFAYDQQTILNDLSLTIQPHHITGIIGKSGSGKSTLLKLIMRFYDANQGNISVNQRLIQNINTKDLRHMFASVTQETVLFHDSIYNNLKIAKLDACEEEIITACQKAQIHDFILSLPQGYHTTIAELGSSLSGGERQRLGLARAFLSNAPCILLDEPTSHLDVLNEGCLLQSLLKTNQTIVLVSHRESTMKIAHSFYKIEKGKQYEY